jgi:hypothetical protein
MHNKIVVATAIAAILASGGLFYAPTNAFSTMFATSAAVPRLEPCADLGPAAASGLPVSASVCEP